VESVSKDTTGSVITQGAPCHRPTSRRLHRLRVHLSMEPMSGTV